jgi:hypothetical protein
MVPMALSSTHFISYHDLRINETDLLADAWGFNTDFHDVIDILGSADIKAGQELTDKLIRKIREHH